MTSWFSRTALSRRLPRLGSVPEWKHLKDSSYAALFSNEEIFCSFIRIRGERAVLAMNRDDTASSRSSCLDFIRRTTVRNISELEKFLEDDDRCSFTILSMDRYNQMFPINATGEVMQRIFEHYELQPQFAPIFAQCCTSSNAVWEAVDGLSAGMSAEGTFTVQYRFRYAEENGRSGPEASPWSVRQIGVHHKFSAKNKTGHIIFFHPVLQSEFQNKLEEPHAEPRLIDSCIKKPLDIHCMLLSHLSGQWRAYLDAQGRKFSSLVDKIFMMEKEKQTGLRPNTELHCMQELRRLEERLLPLPSLLRSSQNIAQCLEELNAHLFKGLYIEEDTAITTSRILLSHADTVRGQAESIEVMLRRISGALGLLVDTLAIQNHAIGETMSRDMLSLAKNSANDSAAVRAITFVTLLYLPTTFIATVFGSNFFNFNTNNSSLQISPQIWMFIATSICLTTGTIGWWVFVMRKRRVKDTRTVDAEASIPP